MSAADAVLKRIEGESEKYPIIIGPERGKVLDEVVKKHRPKTVLEVGTLVGYSAIRIGRLLQRGGKVTCLELDGRIAEVARKNIADAGLGETISVVVGDARKTIPKVEGPLDMVFLDAEKTEYSEYLRLVEPMLHKGSVVAADNVKSHAAELKSYLDHVRNSGNYSSSYQELGLDAVEVSVRL